MYQQPCTLLYILLVTSHTHSFTEWKVSVTLRGFTEIYYPFWSYPYIMHSNFECSFQGLKILFSIFWTQEIEEITVYSLYSFRVRDMPTFWILYLPFKYVCVCYVGLVLTIRFSRYFILKLILYSPIFQDLLLHYLLCIALYKKNCKQNLEFIKPCENRNLKSLNL